MFEIIFSIPVTMSVWTVLLGQKVEFFQVLCIYLVLGIGADDAFILHDAWLQANIDSPVASAEDWTRRFAWAYRRAFSAMMVTTATTCGSFIVGAVSVLPQVRSFCIFAAILVFVDWLFCITFFASAIVVNERYFASKRDPGECGGPGCCCGLARFLTWSCCPRCATDVPQPGDLVTMRPLERFCDGPLFKFLNRWRFCLVGLWLAVVVSMLAVTGTCLSTADKASPIGRQSLDVVRTSEVMLDEFSLLGTPTTSFVYGLDDKEPITWGYTHDHNTANYDAAQASRVTTVDGQLELLRLCRAADAGADEAGTRCEDDRCLVQGRGLPGNCHPNMWVYRQVGISFPDDVLCLSGRYCFMEEFARYWAFHLQGAACLGLINATVCSGTGGCEWDAVYGSCHPTITEFDYPGLPAGDFIRHLASDEYEAYMKLRSQSLRANGRDYEDSLEKSLTGFRLNWAKTALQVAWVSFNATYRPQNTVEQANGWYDRWEAFRLRHSPNIGGFQTTEMYRFMVTQNEMVRAAGSGIFLSLLLALLVLLLTTKNWRAAVLGVANIAAITSVFFGILPCIGWSLGENECIFLIAVVGLSVDYTVHLIHAYFLCEQDDRQSRAQHALAEMGISVINSAITTLLASAVLFCCGFWFFVQFGGFIFIVIGLAIIMSIFFLMPLMMVIGPEGKQGDLRWMCRRRGSRRAR